MANPTKDFGLLPWKDEAGRFAIETLNKTSGAANYRGDPLSLVAAGTYTKCTVDTPIDAVCAVAASATDTTIQAWLTSPTQRWLINSDAAVAITDCGGAFDINVNSADTTHNISGDNLDVGSIDTTGQMILMDKHPNDTWGEDDVRCIVTIHESKFVGTGTAAPVTT